MSFKNRKLVSIVWIIAASIPRRRLMDLTGETFVEMTVNFKS